MSFSQQDSLYKSGINDIDLENTEEEEFIFVENRIIKNIIIQPLDVAGKTLNNETDDDPGWFGNISNSLHFKTREWVIRNWLLFKEGDKVASKNISESERLLRSSGYFLDSRIRIETINQHNDSINIIVTTKDRWTLTPLISYNSEEKHGYLGLKDENLLGMGHKLETTITYDQNRSIGFGTKIYYVASNVLASFIDAGARFESNRKSNFLGLHISRSFVTIETEWAGGLDISRENNILEFRNNSGDIISLPYRRQLQDIWIGKSYPIWFGSEILKKSSRIVTSARISRIKNVKRPEINGSSARLFENNTLYLGSLGYIFRRFYKDYYIEKFGITEDVAIGGMLTFTAGLEEKETTNRWYTSAEAVYSKRIQDFGYISGRFAMNGFRNINKWEQNIFLFNLIYHSPLFYFENWMFRFFLENDLLFGFNRFTGEQIYLDIENKMRGFESQSVFGTKKEILNFETRIFSPYSLLGFNLGAIIFADFGLITGRNIGIGKSKLYQSYGSGFRIRNESIARTNFEIAVVYNPYNPVIGKDSFKIIFTGSLILGNRNFGFTRPSIIPYGNLENL